MPHVIVNGARKSEEPTGIAHAVTDLLNYGDESSPFRWHSKKSA